MARHSDVLRLPDNLEWIDIGFVKLLHDTVRESPLWPEPMPDFNTRYDGILESCLNQPLVSFEGQYLYKDAETRISILFYLLIKNHPFKNGNKRMAVVCLSAILYANGFILEAGNEEIYNLAINVAESTSKEAARKEIVDFISKNLRRYPQLK